MSLKAIATAIELDIEDPLAKFILVLLSNRHNQDTGDCFPSLARLCKDSAVSRSTAIRKLEWLEQNGFIKAIERRRADGTRTSNAYRLLFINDPEPLDEGDKTKTKRLPVDDFRPNDRTIQSLRERYPHHDTTEDTINYLVREWIDFCRANGKKYIDHQAAFRQSAERYYRRASPHAAR